MNALRQIVGVAPGLHAGATLADALQAWGFDTLLIAGYMTHNCFDSTRPRSLSSWLSGRRGSRRQRDA